MTAHLRYLWYVLRHKWYVFRGCMVLGVPLWRAITHDASKFSRAEWGPYVQRFFGPKAHKVAVDSKGYDHNLNRGQDAAFDAAWKHHWKNNRHHPEYWVVTEMPDDGSITIHNYDIYDVAHGHLVKSMPETYVREMVADWYGAGMAQGKPDIYGWYVESEPRKKLHSNTRRLVAQIVQEARDKGLFA